jgi:uncharacterized peroxidase-related enzyme
MPWIKVIDEDEADGLLREIYDEAKGKRGKVANVLKIHSLLPDTLEKHLSLYLSIMFRRGSLKRWVREMIAVYVSKLNNCEYCIRHHSEALAHYWDRDRVSKFLDKPESVGLLDRELRILDYVEKITLRPYMVNEEDVNRLKEAGLSDEEILHINLIASYFNFVNRIVLGLGVEYSEEEVKGYKY